MEQILIDILVEIVLLWLAYRLGQHVAALRITRQLIEDTGQLEQAIARAREQLASDRANDPNSAEELRVEQWGDQLYVYSGKTEEFLGQGTTLEEALAKIQQRFPERAFRGHLTKQQADQLGIRAQGN